MSFGYLNFGFFDILHNDESSYIIIQSQNGNFCDIKLSTGEPFTCHGCGWGRSRVYECRDQPYNETINLVIDGVNHTMPVSKYPSYKDEIIMATCVKYEDEYVVQWIDFHKKLGITRFIFYDNSANQTLTPNYRESISMHSDLRNVIKDYIADGTALVIDWPYQGGPNQVFQPGQQSHSINAFKTAKYIGLLDVDEYICMTLHTNIREVLKDNNSYSLRSRYFYNPNNQSTSGYDFLKIFTCIKPEEDDFYRCPIRRGDKVFVYPKTAYTAAIHCVSTPDHVTEYVNPEVCLFNHYRFLNKKTAPGPFRDTIINDDILRLI